MSRRRKFLLAGVVAFFAGLVVYLLSSNKEGEKNLPSDSVSSDVLPTRPLAHEDGISSPTLPSVSPVLEESVSQSIPVLVTWRNSQEPVESVSVTLSPLSPSKAVNEKIQPVTGLTNKSGQTTLKFAPDILLPRNLCCQVQVDGPGAAPLLIENVRVYTTQTLELAIDKVYDFYGTVYWNPQGTGMVPAPGAQVAVVGTTPNSQVKRDSPSVLATATTDAQGHYEVRGFPDSPVHIWARLGEFVMVDSPVTAMLEHGKRSGPFDLHLEHGLTLVALVSDKATLQPIPNATVGVEFAGGGLSLSGTTNGEGFCNLVGLPTGSYQPFAHAEGYTYENISIEVTRDADNAVAFYLGEGGKARIQTIEAETEQPIGNVGFKVRVPYRRASINAQTDDKGLVLVEGIPIGPKIYLNPNDGQHALPKISIGGRRGETKEVETSFIAEKDRIVDVVFRVTSKPSDSTNMHDESPKERHSIEGEVVDEAGKPIQGALVTAISECCCAKTMTNSEGQFCLENVCLKIYPSNKTPLPDITAIRKEDISYEREIDLDHKELYVGREGYVGKDGIEHPYYIGPATLKVEADLFCPAVDILTGINQKARIVLHEKSKGILTGRVLDNETKEPVSDYTIGYNQLPYSDVKRVFSKEGTFKLYGLAVGEGTIAVIAEGYAQKVVSVKPNEKGIEILLDRPTILTGIIVDGETKTPQNAMEVKLLLLVGARSMSESWLADYPPFSSVFTDPRGRFQISNPYDYGTLFLVSQEYGFMVIPLEDISQYKQQDSGEIVIPLERKSGKMTAAFFQGARMLSDEGDPVLCSVENETLYRIPDPEKLQNGTYTWKNLRKGNYMIISKFIDVGKKADRMWKAAFGLGRHEVDKMIVLGRNDSVFLSGRILKSSGEVCSNVHVNLTASLEEGGNHIEVSYGCDSDAGGFYQFENIAAGIYTCTIQETDEERVLGTWDGIMIDEVARRDFILPNTEKDAK